MRFNSTIRVKPYHLLTRCFGAGGYITLCALRRLTRIRFQLTRIRFQLTRIRFQWKRIRADTDSRPLRRYASAGEEHVSPLTLCVRGAPLRFAQRVETDTRRHGFSLPRISFSPPGEGEGKNTCPL
jgi:hypothetical protein